MKQDCDETDLEIFRLFALLVFVFVGGMSISNLVAEFLRPATSPLRSRIFTARAPDQVESTRQAAAIAPFRSDLKADYALALAGQTLKSEYTPGVQADETAQNAVKDALKIGPHDSRMWLVLALLQTRSNLGGSLIAESLKMSYLTGPNRAELIPTRLETVILHQSLNDADLKELARADVRLILTQIPVTCAASLLMCLASLTVVSSVLKVSDPNAESRFLNAHLLLKGDFRFDTTADRAEVSNPQQGNVQFIRFELATLPPMAFTQPSDIQK